MWRDVEQSRHCVKESTVSVVRRFTFELVCGLIADTYSLRIAPAAFGGVFVVGVLALRPGTTPAETAHGMSEGAD